MRAIRATAAIAVLALVVGACGGTTATAAPTGAASPAASAAASDGAAPSDGASAPANTPIAIGGSTPAPGQTEIRWYCCLGGGDAPEQVEAEKKVVEAFNASHPNIHLTFEAVPYAGANDALATEIASGNGPDIVGPVGIGGANAFHGQWLDLAPLIAKQLRPVGLPAGRGRHLQARRGPGRDPVRDLPVGPVLRQEPVRRGRPRVPAPQVRRQVHDARRLRRRLELRHDPKVGKILTVDKNGKDATQDGFDPANIVQWGFEPQRDDLRGMGAYFGAGTLAGADGKTAQIPDAWKAAWKDWYDEHVDRPHQHDRADLQQPGHQPRGLPVLHRQGRDEQQLPVVDLRPGGARGDWDMGIVPRTTARRPRRSTRTRSASSRAPSTPTRRSRS